MKLIELLGLESPGVVCLVGSGGKTSLMYALAAEAAADGLTAVVTTTTKIFRPAPDEIPNMF